MPIRKTLTQEGTFKTMRNMSFENVLIGWFMQDGWQVFKPVLDDGHQTDVLISDGPNFYRIQVKTFEDKGTYQEVHKDWNDNSIDCVIYFSRNSKFGYVAPAFREDKRLLEHPDHIRFSGTSNSFIKAFHNLEVNR